MSRKATGLPGIVTNPNRSSSLENASNTLFNWFSDNLFKGNANKSHLLFTVNDEISMKKGDFNIPNCKCEKLLGVKDDYKLDYKRCLKLLEVFYHSL